MWALAKRISCSLASSLLGKTSMWLAITAVIQLTVNHPLQNVAGVCALNLQSNRCDCELCCIVPLEIASPELLELVPQAQKPVTGCEKLVFEF